MKTSRLTLLAASLVAILSATVALSRTAEKADTAKAPVNQPPIAQMQEPPRIDVVFALDTTGSMSGLIEGAKQKIWSIADKLVSGNPRPEVRMGLVAYRDLGVRPGIRTIG